MLRCPSCSSTISAADVRAGTCPRCAHVFVGKSPGATLATRSRPAAPEPTAEPIVRVPDRTEPLTPQARIPLEVRYGLPLDALADSRPHPIWDGVQLTRGSDGVQVLTLPWNTHSPPAGLHVLSLVFLIPLWFLQPVMFWLGLVGYGFYLVARVYLAMNNTFVRLLPNGDVTIGTGPLPSFSADVTIKKVMLPSMSITERFVGGGRYSRGRWTYSLSAGGKSMLWMWAHRTKVEFVRDFILQEQS